MARNLLPIRILFHTAFVLLYVPIIALGFTSGLSLYELQREEGISDYEIDVPFVLRHFDGMAALAALVGLTIFSVL